jgi:DnaJ-class molecular chaperone
LSGRAIYFSLNELIQQFSYLYRIFMFCMKIYIQALSDLQENRVRLFQETVTGEMKSKLKSDKILGLRKDGTRSTGNVGVQKSVPSFSKSILRKPPPMEKKLECTLEELATGCKKEFKFTRDFVMKNG